MHVMCPFRKWAFQSTRVGLSCKIKRVIAALSLYLHCTSSVFTLARLRLKLLETLHPFTVTRLQPERTPPRQKFLFQCKSHRCILLLHQRRPSIGTSCEIPRLRECGGTSTNLLKNFNQRSYSGHGSEKKA